MRAPCVLFALLATLAVLDGVLNPLRSLVMYRLVQSKCVLFPRAHLNGGPTAERTAPFYARCVGAFEEPRRFGNNIDLGAAPLAHLVQLNAAETLPPLRRQQSASTPWFSLVSDLLPAEDPELQWRLEC